MRRVILESPYGNADPAIIAVNARYARACVRDSLLRGEAPIASHLLYTQEGILQDQLPAERALGIEAGLMWLSAVEAIVVYLDRGISKGMRIGIERAREAGVPVEMRRLGLDAL